MSARRRHDALQSQEGRPPGSRAASVSCGETAGERGRGNGLGTLPRPFTLPRPLHAHSYLNASTGSSFAARAAGAIPNTSPMTTETAHATAALQTGTENSRLMNTRG